MQKWHMLVMGLMNSGKGLFVNQGTLEIAAISCRGSLIRIFL